MPRNPSTDVTTPAPQGEISPAPAPAVDAPAPVPVPPPVVRLSVEDWEAKKQPAPHALAAARVLQNWAEGRQVTEAEFDDALSSALNVRVGGTAPSQKKE